MQPALSVPPLRRLEKWGDLLMIPLMYLASGTFRESPQRTHRWNAMRLSIKDVPFLEQRDMVRCENPSNASSRRVILFHIPLLGGWRDYVVLEPEEEGEWHAGWITSDAIGLSRIPLQGQARLLLGPKATYFFGIRRIDGRQVALRKAGTGRIGEGGFFRRTPLL